MSLKIDPVIHIQMHIPVRCWMEERNLLLFSGSSLHFCVKIYVTECKRKIFSLCLGCGFCMKGSGIFHNTAVILLSLKYILKSLEYLLEICCVRVRNSGWFPSVIFLHEALIIF